MPPTQQRLQTTQSRMYLNSPPPSRSFSPNHIRSLAPSQSLSSLTTGHPCPFSNCYIPSTATAPCHLDYRSTSSSYPRTDDLLVRIVAQKLEVDPESVSPPFVFCCCLVAVESEVSRGTTQTYSSHDCEALIKVSLEELRKAPQCRDITELLHPVEATDW